jgi:serine/threonine protein kinase/tetratricopeptide (TPR) repeat protein
MNRLMFQQVEALFETALGFDPPTRELFLDRVGREHSLEVRDLLERLLARDGSSTRWTDLGAGFIDVSHATSAELPGTIIGKFRLIERLGVGGHGEVYLAEQLQPVRRQVALKMVLRGSVSDDAIARFRAEEQALAMMNHPGIAAVYEAGLADHGRLYFAMEHVDGEPIDAWCDRRRLAVPKRLDLFLKVCHAVQHAHQKGVIHRDLKPSNILVTDRDGEATPVLIDFGIAAAADTDRAIHSPDAESTVPMIGTPAYMSPEQAGPDRRDIDTRSDVFALGIVLYELLTGRTPLDILAPPRASLAEIRRCIAEGAAPSPMAVLNSNESATGAVAKSRHCTPRQLRHMVRGDLDAIVCKAIARDRAHRYQTVDALARDIENHLSHRPVSAATPGALTMARKFVRRHRLVVAASLALLATMAAAIVGTTIGMVRAERSQRQAHAVNSFLQDLLTSSRPMELGASVRFVDVLEVGSATAAERFSAYPQQEGEVRQVLGHTYYTLGMYAKARPELERSLELLRQALGMSNAATLRSASLLSLLLVSQGSLDGAEALANEIIAHSAGEPRLRERFLSAQWMLADIQTRRGHYDAAETEVRRLIALIDSELGPTHLDAYNARMTLADILRARALRLETDPKATALREELVTLLGETVDMQKQRFGAGDSVPVLTSQLELADVLLELQRVNEAEAVIEPMEPIIRARFGEAHWLFRRLAPSLAFVRYVRGDYEGAADVFMEVLQPMRASMSNPSSMSMVRDALPYLDAGGRADDGLALARELHDALAAMVGADNLMTLDARIWIARFCGLAGLLEEAERHFAEILPLEPRLMEHSVSRRLMLLHAGHLAATGRYEEAETRLHELCALQGDVTNGVNHLLRDDIARMYVEVYDAWDRRGKVVEYLDVVASIWSR